MPIGLNVHSAIVVQMDHKWHASVTLYNFYLANTCFGQPTNYSSVQPLRSKLGRISIHVWALATKFESILYSYTNLYKSFYVLSYIFKSTTKMYSTVTYEYDLQMPILEFRSQNPVQGEFKYLKPLYIQLKCHMQHNVYSHLDMYTSDVSRFKYRVNQLRMYITNRHINTYRVYGSIISTKIHKPGRCTFFLLEQHPFFSEATTTSWPFPMRATYGPSILLLLNAHSARLAYLQVWHSNPNEMSPSLTN